MAKFKITDKYVAFANDVAGGMDQYLSYIKNVAVNPNVTKGSAMVSATRLMSRPQIRDIVKRAQLAREGAITEVKAREVAEEFRTQHLTTEEMDSLHYAIIQGKVLVEEVIPQWTATETFDRQGNVISRQRVQNFVRVSRPPNIREKQISIDAMYKRHGKYARIFKGLNDADDSSEEQVERVVVLSDGSTMKLLS